MTEFSEAGNTVRAAFGGLDKASVESGIHACGWGLPSVLASLSAPAT
jgi:hypothetical protein